jgi:hypothetical protein
MFHNPFLLKEIDWAIIVDEERVFLAGKDKPKC